MNTDVVVGLVMAIGLAGTLIPILPGPDHIRGTEDDVPDNLHPRIVELSPAVFEALDNLGLPHSAYGVLVLGNRALAGDAPGVSYADVNAAVSAINDLTDECALTIHCETLTAQQSRDDAGHVAAPTGSDADLSAVRWSVRTPNPLRSASQLRMTITLPEQSRVRAGVYSVSGREIARLEDRVLPAGDQILDLPLSDRGSLPGGIYFLRLETQGEDSGRRWNASRKLAILP